jgi:hypothetical protein
MDKGTTAVVDVAAAANAPRNYRQLTMSDSSHMAMDNKNNKNKIDHECLSR